MMIHAIGRKLRRHSNYQTNSQRGERRKEKRV
jgi:hypothetical protein